MAQPPRTSSLGSALEEIWKPARGGSENPLAPHLWGDAASGQPRQDLSDSLVGLIHLEPSPAEPARGFLSENLQKVMDSQAQRPRCSCQLPSPSNSDIWVAAVKGRLPSHTAGQEAPSLLPAFPTPHPGPSLQIKGFLCKNLWSEVLEILKADCIRHVP